MSTEIQRSCFLKWMTHLFQIWKLVKNIIAHLTIKSFKLKRIFFSLEEYNYQMFFLYYYEIRYCNLGSPMDLPTQDGVVELYCGVKNSNPNAVFTWMKDGLLITRNPVYYKNDGRVLVIPDFEPADNGRYTCITNDNILSSSSTILDYVSPGIL